MDRNEYQDKLVNLLNSQKDHFRLQISGVVQHLPEKAEGFDIGIHPDQDGSGCLDIMIHPVGPDVYVLNKAVKEYRNLLEIMPEPGTKLLTFGLPHLDTNERDFYWADVQVEICINWFKENWNSLCDLKEQWRVIVYGTDCDAQEAVLSGNLQ